MIWRAGCPQAESSWCAAPTEKAFVAAGLGAGEQVRIALAGWEAGCTGRRASLFSGWKEIDVSCISAHDPQLSRLADAIAQRVGQQRFNVWFNNSTRLELKQDGLEIAVPNDFISEWIATHFTRPMQDAAHEVLGCSLAVRFHVMPQLFEMSEGNGDGNGNANGNGNGTGAEKISHRRAGGAPPPASPSCPRAPPPQPRPARCSAAP